MEEVPTSIQVAEPLGLTAGQRSCCQRASRTGDAQRAGRGAAVTAGHSQWRCCSALRVGGGLLRLYVAAAAGLRRSPGRAGVRCEARSAAARKCSDLHLGTGFVFGAPAKHSYYRAAGTRSVLLAHRVGRWNDRPAVIALTSVLEPNSLQPSDSLGE